jgi:hypothetical protein
MTHHAEVRSQQRAIRDSDIELVLRYGSSTGNAIVMTDADCRREIEQRKREIMRLERLRGVKAIVENGALVTLYRENGGQRTKKRRRH